MADGNNKSFDKVKVEGKSNQSFDIREADLGFTSTN